MFFRGLEKSHNSLRKLRMTSHLRCSVYPYTLLQVRAQLLEVINQFLDHDKVVNKS